LPYEPTPIKVNQHAWHHPGAVFMHLVLAENLEFGQPTLVFPGDGHGYCFVADIQFVLGKEEEISIGF
jgi:hypothetical protein